MTGCLFVGLGLSILFPAPSARITKENYDRLKGVTKLKEVEAILGGPAGDYRTGPTCSCLPGFVSVAVDDESLRRLKWQGDEAEISVWVDPKGRTSWRSYTLMKPQPVGTAKRFLWRYEHWQLSFWQRLQRIPG